MLQVLARRTVPCYGKRRRFHRSVELHYGEAEEGFEVPGAAEFHDDGRCGAVSVLQSRQRDACQRLSGRQS